MNWVLVLQARSQFLLCPVADVDQMVNPWHVLMCQGAAPTTQVRASL